MARLHAHYRKVLLLMFYCYIYWISWSSYISVGTCELVHKEHFFFFQASAFSVYEIH